MNYNSQKDISGIVFERCKVVGIIVIVLEALNIFTFSMIPGMITAEFTKQAFLKFKGHDPLFGDGSMIIMFFINLLWLPSILVAWVMAQYLRIKYKISYIYFLLFALVPAGWFLAVCFLADTMLVKPFVHR